MPDGKKGPVLIELDETTASSPADAPPVPDAAEGPEGRAMQTMAVLATRRPSRLGRWFWRVLAALFTFVLSVWAWNFLTGLIAATPILGYAAAALTGLFLAICAALVIREWAALARLARLDGIHKAAGAARASNDLAAARKVADRIEALYDARRDVSWGRDRFRRLKEEAFDADAVFDLAEAELLKPLDRAATREIEAAARQVATVTALVPIALADVVTALTANLRMIRRIAEIYGGRGGTLGAWRLTRAVFTHLVATGAVAVGDDLIGSVAGGSVLSRVSRRFGEGLINGALTARVGVAAMEVCRPLPFHGQARPSVTGIVQRALTGLFGSAKGAED